MSHITSTANRSAPRQASAALVAQQLAAASGASLLVALAGITLFLIARGVAGAFGTLGLVGWTSLVVWVGLLGAALVCTVRFVHKWRPPRHGPIARPIPAPAAEDADETANQPEIPAGLVQQITRIRAAGGESIHALLLAEIPAQDRQAVVHLAFCPPLAERPELTAHCLDTEEHEVRITQVEAYGVRLEVRTATPRQAPQGAIVEVLGQATAPRSA